MKTDASPLPLRFAVPWEALRGPHLQRLAERWLRRWGFALSGCALGVCGVWWAQPEVSEHHADALQAVAHLSQQLNQQPSQQSNQYPAALSETSPATSPVLAARPDKPLASAAPSPPSPQNLLAHLPAWSPQGRMGTDGPPVWAAHGLRLQSLQPLPSTSPTSAISAASQGNSTGERGVGLPSQAVALRLLGRFEDWARFWAACAMAGPVCSLDRISMVATGQAGEVQIDAVLRIWMRPAEEGGAGGVSGAGGAGLGVAGSTERGDPESADRWRGGAVLTDPAAMAALDSTPFARSGVPLFAVGREGAVPLATSAVRGAPGHSADEVVGAAGAVGTVGVAAATDAAGAAGAAGSGAQAVWPEDPRHWPLAQVRLAGLWQQGVEKRAILSAGTRWAQVTLGQRVTLEGHRVAAITADGVRLRLAPGPSILLGWTGDKEGALAQVGLSKSDRPNNVGPMNDAQNDVTKIDAPKHNASQNEAASNGVSQTHAAKHHAAHEPRPARKGEPR